MINNRHMMCSMTIMEVEEAPTEYFPQKQHSFHSEKKKKKQQQQNDEGIKFKQRRRRKKCRASSLFIPPLIFILSSLIGIMMMGGVSSMLLRPSSSSSQHHVVFTRTTAAFATPILPSVRHQYDYCSSISSSSYSSCNNYNKTCQRNKVTLLHAIDPTGKYLNHISTTDNSDHDITLDTNNRDDEDDVDIENQYDEDDYANSVLPVPVQSFQLEGTEISFNDDATGISSNSINIEGIATTKETSTGEGTLSSDSVNGEKNQADGIDFTSGEEEATTVHPNEEPPLPTNEEYEDSLPTTTIYEDAAKSSKFDIQDTEVNTATAEPKLPQSSSAKEETNNEKETGIKVKNWFNAPLNFLIGGENEANKSKEETERARKWSEWMTSGRKVRSESEVVSSDGSGGGDGDDVVALDESMSSLEKGEDYVVVAVPAEAADGVGPIMSSFPGGKLFQKAVKKYFQEPVVNGDADKNATSSSASATISLGNDKMLKKQKHQKQPRKKNIKTVTSATKMMDKTKKQHLKEENIAQIQKRRQQKHYQEEQRVRERGRVSANDWKHNMLNMGASTILRDVRNPVKWVFLWSTLFSVVYKSLLRLVATASAPGSGGVVTMGRGATSIVLSERWVGVAAWLTRHMILPTVQQHTMMVSAMSFLLVFRTNSAYQRFSEGRKIWNDIVDTARDFSRMLKLYEFAIGTSKCRRINNLLVSFPYLLRHRIRPSLMTFYRVNDLNVERDPENSLLLYPDESLRDTDPEVQSLAYDEEETGSSRRKTRELCWVDKRTLPWKLIPSLELCARAQNRPLWVCDRMAKELAVVEDQLPRFTNRERMAMIGYVDKLSRCIGACERIHQTLVPLNYARHALRSLTVWLWTLPLALVKDLGLMTGPVLAVLSWILFGVYEIGSRIEDPFQGTLRLSIYCDAIRRDVLADAIARDTAFDLEEEGKKSSSDEDGEYDAIFELESESEEYDGDDVSAKKKQKKGKLTDGTFQFW